MQQKRKRVEDEFPGIMTVPQNRCREVDPREMEMPTATGNHLRFRRGDGK